MITTTKKPRIGRTTDSYFALVLEQPLRAIRTKKDYDAAAKMLDRLAVRDDLDDGQQQYLDAIEVLIEAYENAVIPAAPDGRTPLDRLKSILRTSRTSPVQLRGILGSSQSMVSMILGGQRALSKKAIARLAGHFHVDPGYFL